MFGIPESEIAETLREAEREGIELGGLEITTCLERGEIEVVTRYEPDAADAYERSSGSSPSATRTRCSRPTADHRHQVAKLLASARLDDRRRGVVHRAES